jgi:hypothetical protein
MYTYKVSSASIGPAAHACIIDHTVRAPSALDALLKVVDHYCAQVDTVYSRTTTQVDSTHHKSVDFHFTNYILNIRVSAPTDVLPS